MSKICPKLYDIIPDLIKFTTILGITTFQPEHWRSIRLRICEQFQPISVLLLWESVNRWVSFICKFFVWIVLVWTAHTNWEIYYYYDCKCPTTALLPWFWCGSFESGHILRSKSLIFIYEFLYIFRTFFVHSLGGRDDLIISNLFWENVSDKFSGILL